MTDWFLETGLYVLGVALIPAVGLLLACWGVWGDRSKGRTRCPKCWYDMRGSLPKLECPECGHDAREKRRLYNNRRHWRRIALGVLLVLVSTYPLTIVGGWYREQLVIQKITKGGSKLGTIHIGPTWLVDRLPEGFARMFDRVSKAWIAVGGTDADMAECAKLRHLRVLRGFSIQVTDAGLKHLEGLPQLQCLGLDMPQVTDAGLVHLKGLSQLQELDLRSTHVTDAGLVHLKGLSQLQFLSLAGTSVTDVGLVHLKGLSDLRVLVLSYTSVADAGLVHLKGLSQLQELYLGATQVTDAGLDHVKGLSQLQGLQLVGTQVTDAGVAKLKRALPNVGVNRYSSDIIIPIATGSHTSGP